MNYITATIKQWGKTNTQDNLQLPRIYKNFQEHCKWKSVTVPETKIFLTLIFHMHD